jgi:hypothetical protein
MSRLVILAGLGLAVVACTKREPPPQPAPPPFLITPGSRLLWSNGTDVWWAICDQGHKILMSSHGAVATIPGGCPDGRP